MTHHPELEIDNEIVQTRVFEAPRSLVWKAWAELEHQMRWWGPQGFTTTTQVREFKPGGVWRFTMHGPDGHDYGNKITYLEIDEPKLLSYKHGGDQDLEPVNFKVIVTFDEISPRQTKLTMRSIFDSKTSRDFVVNTYGALEGGKQTLGRLADLLQALEGKPQDKAFEIQRVYHNVPVETMWAAWTELDRLKAWFGPAGVTMPQATMDLRVGGVFHYQMQGPHGSHWGQWIFIEIEKPSRLRFTVAFTDEQGNVIRHPWNATWPLRMMSEVTILPHAGIGRGSVVTVRWTAMDANEVEQRTFDTNHESMRGGWTGTLDRLEGFVSGGAKAP